MLGISIVHWIHTEVRIDLRKKYHLIESKLDLSSDGNVDVMYRIDSYTERLDQ